MKFLRLVSLLALGLFGAVALGAAGCQSIAGVEERSLDARFIQCREYCDVVTANCTEENAVYQTDGQCMAACRALEPGIEAEPLGNNVACRLNRARAASLEPAAICRHAGPGGGGGPCGSDCEGWCTLLEHACPAEFGAISGDCIDVCEDALIDLDSFDLERDYFEDTLQCRLVHTLVSLEEPVPHCSHSGLIPDAMCVSGSGEATCESLCRFTQGICSGELAVWDSEEQCLEVCALFEPGTVHPESAPTVGCRMYHAQVAAQDEPEFHCPHAGPTGEGMCGPDVEGVTGLCQNYCLLLEAGCSEHDLWEGDRSDCEAACMDELGDKGAQISTPGYSVARAESGDTLMCRVRQAALALRDPDGHCDAAFGAAEPCQ